jgi:Protein of unknown function (DUF2752)
MLERWVGCPLKASLLPFVLIYWLLPPASRTLIDVPCLFTAVFGIHCPGCGMKTAIIQLLGLDWRGAVTTNPLAPGALAAVVWVSLNAIKNYLVLGGVTRARIFHHRTANDDQRAFA